MDYSDFERYYHEYKHKIYSYLYYRSGRDKALAEDLVSEVFLKALEKFHTFVEEKSFQSWIYAIAHNHLIDHFRKNKMKKVDLEAMENVLEAEQDTQVMLRKRITAEHVGELLGYLSDVEREIILLRYHQGLPLKAIADIVDMTETGLRVRVHRALGKMRKKYEVMSGCRL
ncbi:MAG: RNA polymerase sigma factor [bacterium]|nr:RNA polymerase sigma factor [bacterium]